MLGLAASGGPVGEGDEAIAVLPGEAEEFASVEVGSFLAEEGFEAPLNEGAVPGMKAVAAGGEPIELEEMEHGRDGCQ